MYVVYEAFDDNTAIILDIGTLARYECSEADLIKMVNNGSDILGASVSKQKLNYLNAYNCLSFPTETDADEYIKDNNLSYRNKRYASNYYWVFEKKDSKIHVDYYICTYRGDEITFVSEFGGFTPYIQSAKTFDKHTAKKQAALMTNKSTKKVHWTTKRIVRR